MARQEALSADLLRTLIALKITFFVFLAEFFLALGSLTGKVGAVEEVIVSGHLQRQQESLHPDVLLLTQDLLQLVINESTLAFVI